MHLRLPVALSLHYFYVSIIAQYISLVFYYWDDFFRLPLESWQVNDAIEVSESDWDFNWVPRSHLNLVLTVSWHVVAEVQPGNARLIRSNYVKLILMFVSDFWDITLDMSLLLRLSLNVLKIAPNAISIVNTFGIVCYFALKNPVKTSPYFLAELYRSSTHITL